MTEIGANRRGDVILRFGSTQRSLQGSDSSQLRPVKEEEWISSLKNRTLTVSGLISFYVQEPAMRILEKNQIALLEE